jgi:hypothetical protein
MINYTATLNFKSGTMANKFASIWSHKTLTGHTVSAIKTDGSVDVTVYNVDNIKKSFIDSYINDQNNKGGL